MTIDKVLILASAIIKNNQNEVLVLQRGQNQSFQGFWQVPEGKLEEGESPVDALKREMKEELSIDVDSAELVSVTQTELEAKGMKYLAVRLVFDVKLKSTEITLSHEHSDYQWISADKIDNLELLPGTSETIKVKTTADNTADN